MYELRDKVVLITGAANGIGAAFVRVLLEQGVKHVRVLDIDETAGISLQIELNNKYGDNKLKFSKCDITKDEELFEAFNETTAEQGYIDVVVNNAGVGNESNAELIRKEIDINLTALVNSTLKAIELMRKDNGGKGGTVINVSSIAALLKLSPMLFVYAATKSAILHFSTCIGSEPYHSTTGVRVITVCYGATQTGIMGKIASFDEGINEEMWKTMRLFPSQTPEAAAAGTLEAFRNGQSGSTWMVNNGKHKDITPSLNKAFEDWQKLLMD